MTIVEPVTDSGHADVSDPPPKSTGSGKHKVGPMEASVQADINDIDEKLRVPFHRSLTTLATKLAQEIDEPATAAATRRDARKQLFEVLKSLRTQKEGDDGSALNVLLEQAGFGVPLVPGGAT